MPVETRSGGRYVAGLSQAIALLPIVLRAGFGSLQSKYWFGRLPNSVSEQSGQPTIHCREASKRSTRESIQIERARNTSATTGSGSASLGRHTHRLESIDASMTVQQRAFVQGFAPVQMRESMQRMTSSKVVKKPSNSLGQCGPMDAGKTACNGAQIASPAS